MNFFVCQFECLFVMLLGAVTIVFNTFKRLKIDIMTYLITKYHVSCHIYLTNELKYIIGKATVTRCHSLVKLFFIYIVRKKIHC